MKSYIPIDSHQGQEVNWNFDYFGHHVITINVGATLQEDPTAQTFRFWFHTESNIDGQPQRPVERYLDVAGNIPKTEKAADEDANLLITVEVTDWNLTATVVSCKLSLSIRYLAYGGLGPSVIFNAQPFAGSLASSQHFGIEAGLAKEPHRK